MGKRSAASRAASCVVAGLVTMALAACGSSSDSVSASGDGSCPDLPDGAIKVGSVLPLSGDFAALGAPNAEAAAIAVDKFNETNDICGREVELVSGDDKGDTATAVALGRKLVSDGVSVFIDAGRGQTGDAITPLLMKEGAIVISDVGFRERFDTDRFPTFYSHLPNNEQYATKALEIIQERGWTNVGILTDGLTGGNDYTEVLTQGLESAGDPVVETVTYSPTAIDLTSQLQQLKSAGVETLFLAGTSNYRNIVDSLNALGWEPNMSGTGLLFAYAISPDEVPAGTTDLCAEYLPAAQAPDGTEGLDPITVELVTSAAAEFGDYNPASLLAQRAYSRLLIAKAGIEQAGSLDHRALKQSMDSLTDVASAWPGISYSFTADDHAGYPVDQLGLCQLETSTESITYLAE